MWPIDFIRPRGAWDLGEEDRRTAAVLDDIVHAKHLRPSEHADWYRTFVAIRKLPEVGRS